MPFINPVLTRSQFPDINIKNCVETVVREYWRRQESPKRSRQGTASCKDGSTFEGTLDSKGRPSGFGVCHLSLQRNVIFDQFEGFWEEGLPSGNGKLHLRDSLGKDKEVVGCWCNGMFRTANL